MVKRYKQTYRRESASADNFQDPPKRLNWKLPQVMGMDGKLTQIKNVISDEHYQAYDAAIHNMNQINSLPSGLPRAYASLVDTGFIGYGALSLLLSSNGILHAICDTLATEMLRKWIRFIPTDQDKDVSKRITELEKEFERLEVRKIVGRALYQTFGFGGSYIFPAIGDVDFTNTADVNYLEELKSELYVDDVKIGKGDLKYLTTIEPIWVVPIAYDTVNPFSKFFYKPEYFSVMGKTTHYTRLLKFIYNEAPDIFKPTYLFNGVPLIQYSAPYVSDFEAIRRAVTQIVQRYNLNVLKTNMERILSSNDANEVNQLKNRIAIFNAMRTNTGTLALDKDTEDFEQLSMTLTGLRELESQAAEFMCIVPKTPATKLLGISPQGFNATGEFEQSNFYDLCDALNQEITAPHLTTIMHMAMLNLWGEIDESIQYEFIPLKQKTDKEIAEINLLKSQNDAALQSVGAIDAEDVQNRIRNDDTSGYDGLEEREREFINAVSNEFQGLINEKSNNSTSD